MGRVRAIQIIEHSAAIGLVLDASSGREIMRAAGLPEKTIQATEIESWQSEMRERLTQKFTRGFEQSDLPVHRPDREHHARLHERLVGQLRAHLIGATVEDLASRYRIATRHAGA